MTCADIRGEVTCIRGIWHVYCKDEKCQKQISYANWALHCKKEHADKLLNNRDGNGGNEGDNSVSNEKEPKRRYGQKRNNGTQSASGANANDSSNGEVAPKKKSKVAPKKKSQPD